MSAAARIALLTCAFALLPTPSAAQDLSSYAIEVYRGPIVAPADIIGRGGATLAIAEGASGALFNPAAVANRYAYNGDVFWDWDWALDWLNVGPGQLTADTLRDGRPLSPDESVDILTMALSFVIGAWGVGIVGDLQGHDFCRDTCEGDQRVRLDANRGGIATGFHLMDGALVLGLQLGPSSLTIETGDGERLEQQRFGLSVGALWRPHDLPFRVGLSLALPSLAESTTTVTGRLITPTDITYPWEFGLGFAYRWGERPFNPRHAFDDPTLEAILGDATRALLHPEPTPDQRYILVAADLILIGASRDAIGVRGWLSQEVQRAGVKPSLSLRLGLESEFWANRMRGRVGTYWEPSRFADVSGRLHGTAGLDFRLGEWIWDWRFSTAIDGTVGYFNYMLSIGFWHGS